ncbi:MAG: biotin/lipoyl-containing protein [Enterococcus hulanensis]
METDKATTDVESALDGTLTEIVEEEDATVDIGEVIAWVEVDE